MGTVNLTVGFHHSVSWVLIDCTNRSPSCSSIATALADDSIVLKTITV